MKTSLRGSSSENERTAKLRAEILHEGSAVLFVTWDKLRVVLEMTGTEESLPAKVPFDRKHVENYLKKHKVVAAIDEEVLAEALRDRGKPWPRSYVVTRERSVFLGKPREVKIFLSDKPFGVPSFAGDNNQQEKKISNLKSVKKGDLVAEEIPAVLPRYGMDVFGIPIPAPKLKDNAPVVRKNVEKRDGKYYSLIDGILSVNGRKEINVLPCKILGKGLANVKEDTEFDGVLVIEGMVKGCSLIKCGILICKSIDTTDVEAGVEIYVLSNISNSTLKCGASIYGGKMHSSNVDAKGDVIIADSIEEANIISGGKVVCSKKGIFSSKIKARCCVDTRDVGDASGKLNEISIGVDGVSDKKVSIIQKDIDGCEVDKVNTENALRVQRLKMRAKFPHTEIENHESIVELRKNVESLNMKIEALERKREILLKSLNETRHLAYLRVRGTASPGNVVNGINSSLIIKFPSKSCKVIETVEKNEGNPVLPQKYKMDIIFV